MTGGCGWKGQADYYTLIYAIHTHTRTPLISSVCCFPLIALRLGHHVCSVWVLFCVAPYCLQLFVTNWLRDNNVLILSWGLALCLFREVFSDRKSVVWDRFTDSEKVELTFEVKTLVIPRRKAELVFSQESPVLKTHFDEHL